jgi:AAA+ superfamily predicted ATPase
MSTVAEKIYSLESVEAFAGNGAFLEAKFEEIRLSLRSAGLRRQMEKEQMSGIEGEWNKEEETLSLDQVQRELDLVEKRLLETQARNKNRLANSEKVEIPWRDLVEQCQLEPIAQQILWLLFFNAVSPEFRTLYQGARLDRFGNENSMYMCVGNVLQILCSGAIMQQMEVRRHFSVEAPLIVHHLMELDDRSMRMGSILEAEVAIAPRVIGWINGDPHRYLGDSLFQVEMPSESLEQVVLPSEMLERVLALVEHFDRYREQRARLGLDEVIAYGRAVALLEYGPPGTGKTLLARALAHHTGRPLVSLRASALKGAGWIHDEVEELEGLFREAQLQNGIVFIDECDRFCHEESEYLPHILVEMEKTDTIILMATNRPYKLAPALDRRFTLKIPFALPTARERLRIWEIHLQKIPLGKEVDLEYLADTYPLAGGYIKNAVLAAVNMGVARSLGEEFVLSLCDLEEAARLQERHIQGVNLFRQVIQSGNRLDDLLLGDTEKENLRRWARIAGRYRQIFRQWGMSNGPVAGFKMLLTGTSPTLLWKVAEGLGGELGVPMERIQLHNFLQKPGDEGGTWALRVQELFEIVKGFGHLLVFIDEQEWLCRLDERDDDEDVREFFRQLAAFEGTALLLSSGKTGRLPTWGRVFHETMHLGLPDVNVRLELWNAALDRLPLNTSDIDRRGLAQRYDLSWEQVQAVLHRVCLISAGEGIELSQERLETAVQVEMQNGANGGSLLFG